MTLHACLQERLLRAEMLGKQVRTGMHVPHGRAMACFFCEILQGLQVMTQVIAEAAD